MNRIKNPIKLHVMSDIHLEFQDYEIPVTDADFVILAGDIAPNLAGIKWIKEQSMKEEMPDKIFLYIAGNHEFYGNAHPYLIPKIKDESACSNVLFMEQEVYKFRWDDEYQWCLNRSEEAIIRFLGCTLWTDFELYGFDNFTTSKMYAGHGMNDYYKIKNSDNEYRKFTPDDSLKIHQKSIKFLEKELSKPFNGKTVVITHHLPSEKSTSEIFKNSVLNPAFASNLEWMFEKYKIDLWITGHSHTCSDYRINNTRIILNPRGYPGENPNFNPNLVVEV